MKRIWLIMAIIIITGVMSSVQSKQHKKDDGEFPGGISVSRSIDDCGIPDGTQGYLGWPFPVLGSLDYESCSPYGSTVYERFYPIGLAFNGLIVTGVTVGLMKLISQSKKWRKL